MPRHREARHDTTYLVVRGAGTMRQVQVKAPGDRSFRVIGVTHSDTEAEDVIDKDHEENGLPFGHTYEIEWG